VDPPEREQLVRLVFPEHLDGLGTRLEHAHDTLRRVSRARELVIAK
jgi:hypothetical protein